MAMPKQQPGKSRQDWQTPPELLKAVRQRLFIENFVIDVAASEQNKVCNRFYSEENSGLDINNKWTIWEPYQANQRRFTHWAWCNPPYGNIEEWVSKAYWETSNNGANSCILIPASVGANWWREFVEPYAYVLHLNGRIKFVGAKDYYPKDCSLLLYTPMRLTGSQVWDWRNS